jgi:hypothetical protein
MESKLTSLVQANSLPLLSVCLVCLLRVVVVVHLLECLPVCPLTLQSYTHTESNKLTIISSPRRPRHALPPTSLPTNNIPGNTDNNLLFRRPSTPG